MSLQLPYTSYNLQSSTSVSIRLVPALTHAQLLVNTVCPLGSGNTHTIMAFSAKMRIAGFSPGRWTKHGE